MSNRRWRAIAGIVLVIVAVASPAFAYDEIPPMNPNCIECHGVNPPQDDPDMESGPHGGYRTTTSKCATCHTVHEAPTSGVLLLPAATVKGTCETCHDGSGGGGVYGVLQARVPAVTVASAHRVIDTSPGTITTIPGGQANGADSTFTFSGPGGNLTCTDCHSPHGSSVVAEFTGDRARSDQYMLLGPTVVSSRLLRQRPTSMPVATANATEYGSDWCGACHVGRLSGSGPANNHPVESSANPPDPLQIPPVTGHADPFYYDSVARAGEATIIGTMGKTNEGYVMPVPRIDKQKGHAPICQQCHEDARDVGNDFMNWPQQLDDSPSEEFTITDVDGRVVADNPRFQTFPHESQVDGLLVEDWMDSNFCLNCHAAEFLP